MSTPAIVTGQEAGISDEVFVARLRELLQDTPKPADEQATGTGTALRVRMQTVPINDDAMFSVVADNVTQAVVQTYNPAVGVPAGSVYVDFNTGLLIFGTPPSATTNNITVSKNSVKWRDSVLLETLKDGMREMSHRYFRVDTDSTLTTAVNVWDYTLPAIFFDPNVRLVDVAIRSIPYATERFRPISGWERIGLDTLRLPRSQAYPPGSSVQLTFEAPYTSLSQMEPKAQMLPLWYAAGTLMMFGEQKRVRTDIQNVAVEGQANPVSAHSNSGAALLRQFYTALDRGGRIHRSRRPMTTYEE